MDNPERHATLGIRHRTKTNKHQKHSTQNYKDEQHGPHQKQGGEHSGSQNTDPTKIRGVGVNTWDRKTRTPPKTGGWTQVIAKHRPHQKLGGEHRGSQNTNLTKNRGGEHRGSQRVSSSYFFYIFVVAVSYIYLQVELGTRTEHVTSIFVFFVHIV